MTAKRGIDYAALRGMVSLEQVLQLLSYKPAVTRGQNWRGACPLHKPSSPRATCFSASLDRNLFRCFTCGMGGNQLDLWTAHTGRTLHEAALDLCRQLRIAPPQRPQSS